jgi:hypothetical protein
MDFIWFDETKAVTSAYGSGTSKGPSTGDGEGSSRDAAESVCVTLQPSTVTNAIGLAFQHGVFIKISEPYKDQAATAKVLSFECTAGGGTIIVSSQNAEDFSLEQYRSADAALTATASLHFPKIPSPRFNADALAGNIIWQLGARLRHAVFCFMDTETDHKICKDFIAYAMARLTKKIDGDMTGQQS